MIVRSEALLSPFYPNVVGAADNLGRYIYMSIKEYDFVVKLREQEVEALESKVKELTLAQQRGYTPDPEFVLLAYKVLPVEFRNLSPLVGFIPEAVRAYVDRNSLSEDEQIELILNAIDLMLSEGTIQMNGSLKFPTIPVNYYIAYKVRMNSLRTTFFQPYVPEVSVAKQILSVTEPASPAKAETKAQETKAEAPKPEEKKESNSGYLTEEQLAKLQAITKAMNADAERFKKAGTEKKPTSTPKPTATPKEVASDDFLDAFN